MIETANRRTGAWIFRWLVSRVNNRLGPNVLDGSDVSVWKADLSRSVHNLDYDGWTDVNRSGCAAKGLVEVFVVDLLTKSLGSRMIGLEFAVIRDQVVKIPALVP